MSFDRKKAQLTPDQLDVGEAIDRIYEIGRENLADGF